MAVMVKELQDEHIVSIKVSGFFYKRLKGFLMRVMSKHDQSFIQDFIKHENDLENFNQKFNKNSNRITYKD